MVVSVAHRRIFTFEELLRARSTMLDKIMRSMDLPAALDGSVIMQAEAVTPTPVDLVYKR